MRSGALDLTDPRFDLPAVQDSSPGVFATVPQVPTQSPEE
ncbi:conserved hypothetical protein [Agrobacterium tumefaciens str. Kerr 14]|nr:hypothetical protein pOC-C5.8_498 [Rhizobium rhizogenes]CUX69059.1 conserved hypothetical protein [Agrobacterium tumefaciens str. Kerr 14]